jgi:hypothetical protein
LPPRSGEAIPVTYLGQFLASPVVGLFQLSLQPYVPASY